MYLKQTLKSSKQIKKETGSTSIDLLKLANGQILYDGYEMDECFTISSATVYTQEIPPSPAPYQTSDCLLSHLCFT